MEPIKLDNEKVIEEFIEKYQGFIWSQDRKAGEESVMWLLGVLEAKDKEFADYLGWQGPSAI